MAPRPGPERHPQASAGGRRKRPAPSTRNAKAAAGRAIPPTAAGPREARGEIWLTGFGGQGVVLAAYIIGRACTLHAGKSATMIQSFGPEARGSSCSATLVVQDGEVLYPYVRRPTILVAMSAEGYEKFGDQLADDGLLLFERDLVHPRPLPAQRAFGISSTRIAESLGRSLIQKIGRAHV